MSCTLPLCRQTTWLEPRESKMTWEPELEELRQRRAAALAMGGPDGVRRQRQRGKLTVRERIDFLADSGTFQEFMSLTGHGIYDDAGELISCLPDAQVDGICEIEGRRVIVNAWDFTIRGGSGSAEHGQLGQEMQPNQRALGWRLPLVRLLDTAGGSVTGFETLGRTYTPDGNMWSQHDVKLLDVSPVVSAVLGSVAGLPAVNVCMAHWNVMVKDISHVFPGGPPVVKAAFGQEISKEELGGYQIHTEVSGVVDNLADTEQDAFRQIRDFLSYLPSSVDELAPLHVSREPSEPTGESLARLVPRNRRIPYDMHTAIDGCVDGGGWFEIAPGYGRSRITGLARIGGHPVGVLANNPLHLGGSTDVAGGEKVIRLIQLCDLFHLPIVSFADEPGFAVGLPAERLGIERAGARLICAINRSRVPWVTIVVGRLFGVAGQCQHRPNGMFARYCWPSASWGSMHIQGGVAAAHRSEISASPDPALALQEIERRYERITSPFLTAEVTGQDIIDPRQTRQVLLQFVRDAQRVLRTQVGPPAHPYSP
jgi:acetyl-CoA carboxylase carboxyltransferase component